MTVVETDLGEYILQINDYEPPSHIIGPALHKSRRRSPSSSHASTARRARTASRSCASKRAACCASTI